MEGDTSWSKWPEHRAATPWPDRRYRAPRGLAGDPERQGCLGLLVLSLVSSTLALVGLVVVAYAAVGWLGGVLAPMLAGIAEALR